MKLTWLLAFISVSIFSCTSTQQETDKTSTDINPPAEGFNTEASDSSAMAIADSVMVAMGGRKAWDNTRFIYWNFFGIRELIWDKHTGNVRIDYPKDSAVYLINVKSDTGRVLKSGEEITQPDSLKKYVNRGKSIWVNDSYWLVMPFKLKDSGVTLTHAREDTTMKGLASHVLTLNFENVGDTPDNKYEVFVDKNDWLVKQWSYYRISTQDNASAVWPWDNYENYGGILLSSDRSDNRGPKDVKVYDSLPEEVFQSFEKPLLH